MTSVSNIHQAARYLINIRYFLIPISRSCLVYINYIQQKTISTFVKARTATFLGNVLPKLIVLEAFRCIVNSSFMYYLS